MRATEGVRGSRRVVLAILGFATIAVPSVALSSTSATASTPGSASQLIQSSAIHHGGAGWQVSLSDPTITNAGSPSNTHTGTVACPSTSDCYLVGGDDSENGYVLATTDSGSTWNALTLPPGTGALGGIACP